MPQIFHPAWNTISRWTLYGLLPLVLAFFVLLGLVQRSPYATRAGDPVPQPVPFSHKHHVGGLGLDCRYCHTSVENSSFAGMPGSEICMTCHSQIWNQSAMLAPVRASERTGRPIRWRRVYDLPNFVYFDHGIHVSQGVGCVSCHGRMDRMPITQRAQALTMGWCLSCHRDPAPHLRPHEAITSLSWTPPGGDARAAGQRLMSANHIHSSGFLTDCYTCHR